MLLFVYSPTISYILYGRRTMKSVHHLIALFASIFPLLFLFLFLLLLLFVIYDGVMICILLCPCPSVPTSIITTLFYKAYTFNYVILLIVLYDSIMLVRMYWYTGDSETTIRDDIPISYQYRIPGATNYILSEGNGMNANITITRSSSLSAATATVSMGTT